MPDKISVLICTHNRLKELKKCVASVAAQEYPRQDIEILVLDDAGSDGTAAEMPAYLQSIVVAGLGGGKFFSDGKRRGIAAGREFLSGKISSDTTKILYLDDDVRLTEGCLKTLAAYSDSHPEAGVIGARIVSSLDKNQTLHAANFVGGWTFRYSSSDPTTPTACDWVDPACILVPAKALAKIGGFWPGYYRSHEGVDFCLRAKKAGYTVVYNPLARAEHPAVGGRTSPERLYYIYRNKFLVIRRNTGPLKRKISVLAAAVLVLPKYILESVRRNNGFEIGEMRIIFKAVFDGVTGKEGPLA